MPLSALFRLRGWVIVLGAGLITLALAGCASPPPTGNDNDNGNANTGDPTDQDGDGVLDDVDACPGTAPGAVVDETGCPVTQPGASDDDEDGVDNADDLCPDTPAGAAVDGDGCSASQRDTDDDGVVDADDDCPGTPTGEEADANGCGPSQRDTDGDEVKDADDRCADTPAGEQVDEHGCGESQLENDTDGDGVVDPADVCPGTPEGEEVDTDGCAASQFDADNDGVPDTDDSCARTPEGEEVDENGCAASQRDTDNDGVTDDLDDCPDTQRGVEVDENGCAVPGNGGTTPVCGNGLVEQGEQCDPPDGVACDDNCQNISGTGPVNDDCANPSAVTDGTITFSNTDATTDGPDEPQLCNFFDYTGIASDIWYCYTATCTDVATVSLCGSSYDTKLAVYAGCDCPAATPLVCSDDSCGIGAESRVTFGANEGESFLIRVGGYAGEREQGDGYFTVICGPGAACGAGAGSCLAANGSPACEDVECCNAVCGIDRYCCDVDWDEFCTEEAQGLCAGMFPACVDGAGDCMVGLTCSGGTNDGQPCAENADCPEGACQRAPGCDQQDCCQTVCLNDPFCCLTEWDDVCAADATERCAMYEVCGTAEGSCFAEHREPGCRDEECCLLVCGMDPACCLEEWDDVCVDQAAACRE